MIRLGIEGIPFFDQRTGVGQYSKRLIEAAIKTDEPVHFEIIRQLMPHRKIENFPIKPGRKLSYRIVRWLPPIIYFQLYKRFGWTLPYDWVIGRRYKAVVFFNFVAYPVSRRTQSVVVIHDLAYILHKEYISPKNQQYLERFVPKSLAKASRVIAVSENTKRDIVREYSFPEEKIQVVTPAVDHAHFKPQDKKTVDAVLSKLKINKPYILSVGTIEPRKNLTGVLDAFEMLPENVKRSHTLVLVGGKGWLDDAINSKFNKLASEYSVIKTGYVDDNDLPAIYTGAKLFVFPSFFEGFGIPPLEAMACGTPVITADNSSLPEVVGDAALLINAEDTKMLAASIERVLSDADLSETLRKKGLVQASKFSWEESARQFIDLIKEVENS